MNIPFTKEETQTTKRHTFFKMLSLIKQQKNANKMTPVHIYQNRQNKREAMPSFGKDVIQPEFSCTDDVSTLKYFVKTI